MIFIMGVSHYLTFAPLNGFTPVLLNITPNGAENNIF